MTLSARIFGEEERTVRKERAPVAGGAGNLNAFLGEGTSFKGTLTFEGTVRIDGRLEGEIFTKDTLVIGEGAEVSAAIHAGVVVISGTVHGNITAERKIDIHASGRLFGNISTPSLVIEEGVVFEGSCTMGQGSDEGAPALEAENLFGRPTQGAQLT
jgi:cytoskeletal protein CcmA (bactofilin family)